MCIAIIMQNSQEHENSPTIKIICVQCRVNIIGLGDSDSVDISSDDGNAASGSLNRAGNTVRV